jgi:hypothetical protein
LNGEEVAAVEGCIDVDLNFSLSRTSSDQAFGSPVSATRRPSAAWLRFPSFELEPLEQTYNSQERVGFTAIESSTGFEKDITVDNFSVVHEYPDFWIRET